MQPDKARWSSLASVKLGHMAPALACLLGAAGVSATSRAVAEDTPAPLSIREAAPELYEQARSELARRLTERYGKEGQTIDADPPTTGSIAPRPLKPVPRAAAPSGGDQAGMLLDAHPFGTPQPLTRAPEKPRCGTREDAAPCEKAGSPIPRELGRGVAAWYDLKNMTASGEHFNPSAMTAGHRTLPFGTKVNVVILRNGRSVTVRITDRGPFTPGRVIDLSRGAARALDMGGIDRVVLYSAAEPETQASSSAGAGQSTTSR